MIPDDLLPRPLGTAAPVDEDGELVGTGSAQPAGGRPFTGEQPRTSGPTGSSIAVGLVLACRHRRALLGQ